MDNYEAEKALYTAEMIEKLEKFVLEEVSKEPKYVVDLIIGAKKLGLGKSAKNDMLPSPRFLTDFVAGMVERGTLEVKGSYGVYAQKGFSERQAQENDKKPISLQVFEVEIEPPPAYSGAPVEKKTVLAVAGSERDVWDKYEEKGESYGCLTKVVRVESIGEVDKLIEVRHG